MELSLLGTLAPWNFCSVEHLLPGIFEERIGQVRSYWELCSRQRIGVSVWERKGSVLCRYVKVICSIYMMSRHFGPSTLQTQDIWALVPKRHQSDTSAELSGHIGTGVLRTLWHQGRHFVTG